MKKNPFTPPFEQLPREIPIFPLPGVAVMPGTQLPLNIFEPRYLRMVLDVLGSHRMIGMVQPEPAGQNEAVPEVYRTGTAGRITSFSETRDGRLMLVLTGVCRFDIVRELAGDRPYRSVEADWTRFAGDYGRDNETIPERDALLRTVRSYCDRKSVEIQWQDAESLADGVLVDLLTIHLPLAIPEKQALIECIGLSERTVLLRGLLEMSNAEEQGAPAGRH
jgi:Lon protease-like protein